MIMRLRFRGVRISSFKSHLMRICRIPLKCFSLFVKAYYLKIQSTNATVFLWFERFKNDKIGIEAVNQQR